ncbi:DUF5655 domain-containing protein [Acidimicrobiales bacterium]|nr:DUF5655 domain-containing protein [Acidimicrobiales bacterium]
MSEIKLFRTEVGGVTQLHGSNVALEKELQTLMERNLETFLGVRFLASELTTSNGGRIDSLGIDENNAPVIIEYKRSRNENVINQGLFYLDWLMDHKADFTMLAMDALGAEIKDIIDWSGPRLICIAGDFNKYDGYAVQQMGRNIDLVRYDRYGDDLLLLEFVAGAVANSTSAPSAPAGTTGSSKVYKTVTEYLGDADQALSNLYSDLEARLLGLGDDTQKKVTQVYIAFKRLKNFACVEVKATSQKLMVYLKVDPDSIDLVDGFTRDVSEIGHFGTGDLEVTIQNVADMDKAQDLFEMSYELS